MPFIVKCSTANKNTAESQEKENYSVSSPRKHSSFKRKDSQKQEEMVDENVERRNQLVRLSMASVPCAVTLSRPCNDF